MSGLSETMGIVAALAVSGMLAGCEQTGEAGSDLVADTAVAQPVVASREPAPPTVELEPVDAPASTPRPESAARPPVSFRPAVLDFGYIAPGAEAEGELEVHNVGDEPLTITRVHPSCQCTTLSDLTGAVIQPGESVNLRARLAGRSVPGHRKAVVTFFFEGYSQPLGVDLRGEVSAAVKATPAIFNLAGGIRSGHVVVESIDGKTFNILAANGETPRFVGFDPSIDEPRDSYNIEWDFTGVADEDLTPWWIIETDHPECPVLDTWVRHLSTIEIPPREQRWRIADRRILLGRMEPGTPVEFDTRIKNIRQGTLYDVHSLSDQFDAELVSYEPGDIDADCTIRVTPKPDHVGVVYGAMQFTAGAYGMKLYVVGKVME